ncbi:MAG: hypothetical protein AAGA80_24240 [Cyanobacteria bacterium P01_F01_bin.143]
MIEFNSEFDSGATSNDSTESIARVMEKAAAEAGVSIEKTSLSTVFGSSAIGVASTIKGLERIPAKDLSAGVDFGFIYLQGARDVRDGFYKLRLTTEGEFVTLGSNCGRVDVINQQSSVVMRQDLQVNVTSLTIPEDRPPNFVPVATTGIVPNFEDDCAFQKCFLSSNGYGIICIAVPIATCFAFSAGS